MDTPHSSEIQIVTTTLLGAWTWNLEDDSVVMCTTLASLFSISRKQASEGISLYYFLSLIHRDDSGRVRAAIGRAIASERPFELVYRVAGDGMRWVRSKGRCYYDRQGSPIHVTGFTIEAVPVTGTLHTSLLDRLTEARALSVAAKEDALTRQIDAAASEARRLLAAAGKGEEDEQA